MNVLGLEKLKSLGATLSSAVLLLGKGFVRKTSISSDDTMWLSRKHKFFLKLWSPYIVSLYLLVFLLLV